MIRFDDTRHGWIVSLAFWLCLFAAATLYAAAALSPGLLACLTLDREFRANQWRLVALEKQMERLERVIEAQKSDPAFLREQARADFQVAAPGEQRIPVDGPLTLQIGAEQTSAARPAAGLPWYAPVARAVARSRDAVNSLLAAAAALVLCAFGLFYERRAGGRISANGDTSATGGPTELSAELESPRTAR